MKHLSRRWLAEALLSLVLVSVGTLVTAAQSSAATGVVLLAFTGMRLTTSDFKPISQEYQRVLLNVMSVRLNPSTDLTLSDSDPAWVAIPLPAAIGLTNVSAFITTSLNFGNTGTLLAAPPSILQLDLIPLQNLPVFFNSASITAQTYGQVELVLNSTAPGSVVPLCPQSASAGEGCIPYVAITAPQATLRANFTQASMGTAYTVTAGMVQPLVVNIAATVGLPLNANPNSGAVAITPVITSQGNLFLGPNAPYSPAFGVVTGTVVNFDSNTTVTAEVAGTNQIVASTPLQADGTFSLNLPAQPTPSFTLYDFYVSGNGGYVVRSKVGVSSQGTAPGPPSPTDLGILIVPSSTFGSLSGTLNDGCEGTPIEGATLNLLVPDTTTAGSATTCDLTSFGSLSGTLEPPAIPPNCVVVAAAATDDQGHYPVSVTPFTTLFANVPVSPPPGVSHYDLSISAPGYNTTVQQVAIGSRNFSLEHGYLTGTTELSSPNDTGNRLNAMVMAEDSGTNNIENVTLSTIPAGAASGTFTIAVPDAAPSSAAIPVTNFDVFASVQDLFQGSPQKTSGHSIGTAASVGAPPADCSTLTIPGLSPMECVGLGSVYGSVENANPSTTSVRLSKDDVQIMETEPNSIGIAPTTGIISNGDFYNFCAPSDSYVLTHYESGIPIAGSSTPIALTTSQTVSAPCANICRQPVAAPTLVAAPPLP